MSLKIKYIDVPQGAQEAAQVQGPGQPFSNPATVATGAKDVAYATLEPRGWPLDGGAELLPDSPEGFWWSEARSDETGAFAAPPALTFSFPVPYTATGLTFTFWPASGEWCNKLRVCWFRSNTLLAQTTAYPDAPQWTLQQTVESFDKVRIELLSTNIPGHFAKVQMIGIGQTLWFGKQQIASVHMVNEIDPTLSELTVDTMTVCIREDTGLSLAPQENQRLELYRDDGLMAVQYITGSSRESKERYTLSCQSAIGLLEDSCLGGIFHAAPLQQVLDEILDGTPYILSPFFADVTLTGYLPVCTRRQALQQLAFAIGAVVTTRGSGVIQLLPLSDTVSGKFVRSRIFQGGKVETAPKVAKIQVVSHSYTQSQEEEILLDEEPVSGENVLYTFDTPHHGYRITGGTLTGSGANWVTVTAQGPVTLHAKKYIHGTRQHTRTDPAATAQERNNVLTVEDVTLVHAGNVHQVLERLYETARLRQTLEHDAVIGGHYAGQKVATENPWGGQLRGYITAMESDLTSTGHTAAVTILGVEVAAENALYFAGDLYAGEEVLC